MNADKGVDQALQEYVFPRLWSVIGVVAVFGTLVPFTVFVYNSFGFTLIQRIVVSGGILFVFLIAASGLTVQYFRERQHSNAQLALTSLAFEILNSDTSEQVDNKHHYEKQHRVYNITGEKAYLKCHFVGEVFEGECSDGIEIKYLGDYGITDDLPFTVKREEPPTKDGPEIDPTVQSIPHGLLITLPFGEELSGGDRFDITFECRSMGDAPPSDLSVARVHFPMHRCRRIEEFRAEIRVPPNKTNVEHARVATNHDTSRHRDVLVESIKLKQDGYELNGPTRTRDYCEYVLTSRRSEANSLFIFRFRTEE